MTANRSGRWRDGRRSRFWNKMCCAALGAQKKVQSMQQPAVTGWALGESHKRPGSYVIIRFNDFYV
jgi:hypothetical protein